MKIDTMTVQENDDIFQSEYVQENFVDLFCAIFEADESASSKDFLVDNLQYI